jgi:hypothetical protein
MDFGERLNCVLAIRTARREVQKEQREKKKPTRKKKNVLTNELSRMSKDQLLTLKELLDAM